MTTYRSKSKTKKIIHYADAVVRKLHNKRVTVMKSDSGYVLSVDSLDGRSCVLNKSGRNGHSSNTMHLREETLMALITNFLELKQIENEKE